jgi:hypothetical protein
LAEVAAVALTRRFAAASPGGRADIQFRIVLPFGGCAKALLAVILSAREGSALIDASPKAGETEKRILRRGAPQNDIHVQVKSQSCVN